MSGTEQALRTAWDDYPLLADAPTKVTIPLLVEVDRALREIDLLREVANSED